MFQSNLPVTADSFLDRSDELARVEAVAERLEQGVPTWLAILGVRKIGKTSLLLEAARRRTTSLVRFAILDSYEDMPLSLRIFRRYALRILDAVLASDVGRSLEALARRPVEYRRVLQASNAFMSLAPDLRSTILELPDRKLDQDFVEDALRLPEQVAQALNLKCLIAWDEFQELGSLTALADFEPFALMRSIWQRHQATAYVVSGSQRTTLSKLITGKGSPFFQHFSLLELDPFETEDAMRLLTACAPSDRPIGEDIARKSLEVFGGHPFYLQMLGETLTAYPPPYGEGELREAVQELLFSRTGRLSLYLEQEFQKLVGRSTYLAATLRALAAGPQRLTDVALAIGASSGAAARYLERLGDSVTHAADGSYALEDSVFGLWLRWREPGGTVVPMTVVGDEGEKSVAEHLAALGFDLVYQSRASRGAFDLLATRGAAQLGVQVKRSALPLRFSHSEWARMEAEAKRFGWRWVVAAVTPSPDARVWILDPERANLGRQARLGPEAAIENLLIWIDSARQPTGI